MVPHCFILVIKLKHLPPADLQMVLRINSLLTVIQYEWIVGHKVQYLQLK